MSHLFELVLSWQHATYALPNAGRSWLGDPRHPSTLHQRSSDLKTRALLENPFPFDLTVSLSTHRRNDRTVLYFRSTNHQNEGQHWHRITLVDDHVSELRQEARRPRKHTQQVHLFGQAEGVVDLLQDGRTPRHSRTQSLFHGYDHRILNRS